MGKKSLVIFAAGGTGGHLYPSQALARELQNRDIDVLFMSEGLKKTPFFHKEQFPFIDIPSSTPFRGTLFQKVKGLFRIASGCCKSAYWLLRKKPKLVVGCGSFHSFPIAMMAALINKPLVLFEANAAPGKVNRLLSKKSLFNGLFLEGARKQMSGENRVVKMPLWHPCEKMERKKALDTYGLKSDHTTVLIFGGSQGSLKMNSCVLEALEGLKEKIQALHFIGRNEDEAAIRKRYEALGIPHCVKVFEPKMSQAWSAADVVICRSGGGTVAEVLEYEVPALFVPYPYASDDHQRKNAEFMRDEVGGCRLLLERDLNPSKLAEHLMANIAHREEMIFSIAAYKTRRKEADLLTLILERLDHE